MALPARAEGSRSRGSTRRSDDRPRSAGKRRTGGSATGSTEEERLLARDALRNTPQRLLETGKPCASKGCMHGLGQGRRKRAASSTSSASYATRILPPVSGSSLPKALLRSVAQSRRRPRHPQRRNPEAQSNLLPGREPSNRHNMPVRPSDELVTSK